MNKQIEEHPYNEILLSKKKECATDMCNNMDESQDIILSKRIHTAKAIYHMIPFI